MDLYIYRMARFILLLFFLIPSIICFLFVFIYLPKNHEISSKRLHNHVIVVLLACNFILITTELPITLVYSYYGQIQPQSDSFCSFWVGYNNSLYDIGLFLMAFASIERYFLIFHERFMYKWRIIVHYLPIGICVVYPLLFYHLMTNVYTCKSTYYYDTYVCAGTCYQYDPTVSTIDYLANVLSPAILTILANMILLYRVTNQKRAMKRANTWRKYRLMYIQLISISMLYFVIWIPFVIISLIRLFYDPMFLQDLMNLVINYCLYICPLASPFISLIGLPSVRRHLRVNARCRGWMNAHIRNRIRPTGTTATRTRQQQMMPGREYDEHAF